MSLKKFLSSERAAKQIKSRKRGCSFSSSSSSIGQCKFKVEFQAGKRVGTSTPVPSWKVGNQSPSSSVSSSEVLNCQPTMQGGKVKKLSVSARKLAATLWEIDESPPQTVGEDENKVKLREKNSPTSLPVQLPPDSSYSAVSERIDRFEGVGEQRRTPVKGLDSHHTASLMEIQSQSRTNRKPRKGRKNRLKAVGNGLATAMELLKVLNHLWVLEEDNPSASSLVSAVETELRQAKLHVDELLKEQRSNQKKMEQLVRCFADEQAVWLRKERGRMRKAVECVAEEVEAEKKLRKQAERMSKKLGKELADSKASLTKAVKEAEREKRAKEIFEQISDELARGIGEDRARVEELKKQSVKVREEVEKEREMLQLADVLREERVQMKLSEAKYHFQEKNAAVDKLKTELEAYLNNKSSQENDEESPKVEKIKELEAYLKEINFGSSPILDEEDDDSADGDLHSIELNMDNNNKSYKWSFAGEESAQSDSKRNSVEKEAKGRRSFSEKIQWGSICFNRGAPTCKNGDSGHKSPVESDRCDGKGEGEIQKHKSINCLKDHIFSGAKVAPAQSFGYPTPQRHQS